MIDGGRPTIDCLECRHVTRIPKDGVTAMKTNLRLRSLAEKHDEHLTKKEAKSARKTTDNLMDAKQDIKHTTNLCPKHQIIIDFFCTKCDAAGCSTCMMNEHKATEHDTRNITAVQRDQKEQLNTKFYQMDAEIQERMDGIQEPDTLQESKHICKQIEMINGKIKDTALRLDNQPDTIEQPTTEKVNEGKNRWQKQMHEIKDLKSSAQSSINTCPHEYDEQHAAIAESVTRALGKDCKAPLPMALDLDPVIGKLRFRGNYGRVTLGTVSQVKQCKLVSKEVLGMLWCYSNNSVTVTWHGVLAVSLQHKNVIRIYGQQLDGTYKKKTSINLSKKVTTENSKCVAVSADGKFLVARITCLEIYSLTGEYEGTFNFKPGSNENGKSICTNIHPYMVLVQKDMGVLIADSTNLNIVHFTHSGIFVDAIPIPFKPFCITLMPNGLIAASNSKQSNVCVIDMKSKQVVHTLDIDNAYAICYHEQSHTLLVGRCLKRDRDGFLDGRTGAIEQYCPITGRLVARIFEHRNGTCSSPQDMVLTHDSELIVADYFAVRVFDITC